VCKIRSIEWISNMNETKTEHLFLAD